LRRRENASATAASSPAMVVPEDGSAPETLRLQPLVWLLLPPVPSPPVPPAPPAPPVVEVDVDVDVLDVLELVDEPPLLLEVLLELLELEEMPLVEELLDEELLEMPQGTAQEFWRQP
jgi:hypothetical protein